MERCGPLHYFIVAAPALFCPLGLVLIGSPVRPRLFAYLALLLAAVFAALSIIFLLDLELSTAVTTFAGVQALWWLSAGVTLAIRSGKIEKPASSTASAA
jgi:hypothetical protein